ncbi:phenylacetic acid degradation operon negative regulatory protein [Amycolatopsis xylanica]|uniref:Phenylacetic acid degradation operon negative regulatory protein n=1 Tax=Amycolatopsis xylanica TaxID=589385 RepID=A0A1H2TFH3_9PSEU|nr:PaaX family transcriptional regulator C-terminal domain-containing protein [Amycolatopsis xylanica]SDW42517.1 phenylacetic acid degradation operon negative regulatory protein [Amycolatopsis xylanica]
MAEAATDAMVGARSRATEQKGAAPRPTVSRRREVSHASARSLLMTVLGEFVLPRDKPVWTSILVDVLGLLEVEEKSARQALARSSAEGWVVSERVGRRVRWSLTPPGRRLLTEGAERIYGFGNETRSWDGSWLMLIVSVPESKRDLRHRLRTRLTWAGFGSPVSGVWVSPDVTRQGEAQQIVHDLGLDTQAMSFTSHYGEVGEQESMVARSWDLTDLKDRYEDFIDKFTGLNPAGGEAVLRAQTRLVHEWRRFPFLDPQLPSDLLPSNWSGLKAAELFHKTHVDWRPEAQQHWDALVDAEEQD